MITATVVTVGVGFEPTVPFGTPVFKTGSFNHSDTLPGDAFALHFVRFGRDLLGFSDTCFRCVDGSVCPSESVCARLNPHDLAEFVAKFFAAGSGPFVPVAAAVSRPGATRSGSLARAIITFFKLGYEPTQAESSNEGPSVP